MLQDIIHKINNIIWYSGTSVSCCNIWLVQRFRGHGQILLILFHKTHTTLLYYWWSKCLKPLQYIPLSLRIPKVQHICVQWQDTWKTILSFPITLMVIKMYKTTPKYIPYPWGFQIYSISWVISGQTSHQDYWSPVWVLYTLLATVQQVACRVGLKHLVWLIISLQKTLGVNHDIIKKCKLQDND